MSGTLRSMIKSAGDGIRASIFNRCNDATVRTREVNPSSACVIRHYSILQCVYCTTWPAVARAGEAHVTFTAFPLTFPCDAHISHLSSLVRLSDLCSRPVHTWIKLRSVSFACSVFKMPTCTLQQRIFMYGSYVITSSCREVVRRFQATYPGVRVPSREAVNVIWFCWNIRDSPGESAGLACTRYRRPSRTVNSL